MRRLALFAGGFCAAALAFACGLGVRAALLCCAVPAAGGVILFLLRRDWARRVAIVCLGLCAGFGWCLADWQRNVRPLEGLEGTIVTVSAEASEASRATAYGTATAVRLTLEGRTYSALLYGGADLELRPGNWVSGPVRLDPAGTALGDDDLFYGARGFDLRAFLRGDPALVRADGLRPRYWPAAFSGFLRRSLRELLPGDAGAFEAALLSGDTSGLSAAFTAQLARSGMRHVVAVSGMHVGILAGILLLLFGNRRRPAALAGIPLIWLFGLSVGMTHSVVRAAVMQSLLLLAPVLRRENDPPTSLLAALLVILLPNPRAILDAGLQLSFASVAGILLFSGRIFRALWEGRWARRLRRTRLTAAVLKPVLAGAAASLSVVPLTLPLQVLYFRQVSLAAPEQRAASAGASRLLCPGACGRAVRGRLDAAGRSAGLAPWVAAPRLHGGDAVAFRRALCGRIRTKRLSADLSGGPLRGGGLLDGASNGAPPAGAGLLPGRAVLRLPRPQLRGVRPR